MHRRNAWGSGQWTRINLFDGWQVLGAIGLVFGVLAFAILVAQSRHMLPSTGSAFKLVQTFASDRPRPQPSVETTVAPAATPSPSPIPSQSPEDAIIQQASAPHVWSPPNRGVAPYAPPPAATPSATPAPTPTPVFYPTPTPRPCLQKNCP
jgi:hypothetical protein